jgi:hypothetical protein
LLRGTVAAGFETWLVNAKDVKHLPGRPKTDKFDAVWLCKVAERQMIRPSFVPPEIRWQRDVTRYRIDLVGVRGAEKNRVEKLLEDAQIKLSVVASDILPYLADRDKSQFRDPASSIGAVQGAFGPTLDDAVLLSHLIPSVYGGKASGPTASAA